MFGTVLQNVKGSIMSGISACAMLFIFFGLSAVSAQMDGSQIENKADSQTTEAENMVPLCNARHEGQLSCQANRVCACVHSGAVPARGLPDRWHWDCAITRPQCEQPAADGGGYLDPALWPVIIDRRDDKKKHRPRPPQ